MKKNSKETRFPTLVISISTAAPRNTRIVATIGLGAHAIIAG